MRMGLSNTLPNTLPDTLPKTLPNTHVSLHQQGCMPDCAAEPQHARPRCARCLCSSHRECGARGKLWGSTSCVRVQEDNLGARHA